MIPIKSEKEIQIMAENGKILARVMKEIKNKVEPGITTKELDRLAQSLIFKSGKCSFKGYNGFPTCLCTSINEEIVHGVPSNRVLKQGDIVSLDLGLFLNGFHADMAITVPVGEINPETRRVLRVTKKVLKLAIKKVRPGITFGDIGNTIQRYVKSQGFNVVRELCGHGIGKNLHEEPQVLNFGKRKTGPKLVEGMVFCIEPMVVMGDYKVGKVKNGLVWKTKDNSLSCHFEHTIAVTVQGSQVLTNLQQYAIM